MLNTSVATILWRGTGLIDGHKRYGQKLDENRFYKKLKNFKQQK